MLSRAPLSAIVSCCPTKKELKLMKVLDFKKVLKDHLELLTAS